MFNSVRFESVAQSVAALASAVLFSVSVLASHEARADQREVVFFPSTAALAANGDVTMAIQGRIYERAGNSHRRRFVTKLAAIAMNLKHRDAEQSTVLRSRLGDFISDSSGGRSISLQIGERVYTAPASDRAGYFGFDIALSKNDAEAVARDGTIPFQSLPFDRSGNTFQGAAVIVPEQGITVVTDIDDTIKVTNMLDRKEKLRYTFLRPFQAVSGMAELYSAWKARLGSQIHFHVVSAGPWQLHAPLAGFFAEKGFPRFTWDMRSVDATNPFIWPDELHPDARRFKVAKIEALICRFPQRQFVLVGDSGEQDPEAYADVAAKYPSHVSAIYIRDMKKPGQSATRFTDLFGGELASKFRLFTSADEIAALPSGPAPQTGSCS